MSFNENYIDVIALRIHEIADKDPRIVKKWGSDGSTPALLRAYAPLALRAKRTGVPVTLEDVHDTWAAWVATVVPVHEYIIPMEQVPPEIQELDEPYADAINEVARSLLRLALTVREGLRSLARSVRQDETGGTGNATGMDRRAAQGRSR